MKKLIVSKSDGSLVYVSNMADVVENGIDVGGLVFPSQSVDVFEVDVVPDGVTVQTHCYTVADGFFANPGYNVAKNPEIDALKEQNAQIILTLVMNDLM
jgi:hypothetical protein